MHFVYIKKSTHFLRDQVGKSMRWIIGKNLVALHMTRGENVVHEIVSYKLKLYVKILQFILKINGVFTQ